MAFVNKSWIISAILHNTAVESNPKSTKALARSWISAYLDRFYWDDIILAACISDTTVGKYIAWLNRKEDRVMPSGPPKSAPRKAVAKRTRSRRKAAVDALGKRIGGRKRSTVVKQFDGFDLLNKVCKFCSENGGVDAVAAAITSLRLLQLGK